MAALVLTHARFQLIETARTPIAVIGSAFWPAASMLAFVVPFVGDDPVAATYATASMVTFAVMSTNLFQYGVGVADDRVQPWEPYVRTLPAGAVPRSHLAGCDHPHGLYVDAPRRLAFVACDGNARLFTLDLERLRPTGVQTVGESPDVLAFDPGLRRLYVAAESGEVAVFSERGRRLVKLGQALLADEAHTVAVDPRTHLVYFPLEGGPVLRVMRPVG